jgi:flagellar hook protein FlgE
MSGMYAAISGLNAHQTMLDVSANNLANVDTVGYKRQRADFSDELAETIAAGGPANGYSAGTDPMQIGLGARVGSVDNVMVQGGVKSTAKATDVEIQGDGFLRVANGDVSSSPPAFDATEYTRAGDLTFNASGYLTTQTGQFVLGFAAQPVAGGGYQADIAGGAGNPIVVPPGSTDVTIGPDGAVGYVSPAGLPATAGYISLATFANQSGLQRVGGSLWTATLVSGSELVGQPATGNYSQTISGQLEQSNVDMGAEFIDMIEAERGYTANAGTITTADRMMQAAVQMKR